MKEQEQPIVITKEKGYVLPSMFSWLIDKAYRVARNKTYDKIFPAGNETYKTNFKDRNAMGEYFDGVSEGFKEAFLWLERLGREKVGITINDGSDFLIGDVSELSMYSIERLLGITVLRLRENTEEKMFNGLPIGVHQHDKDWEIILKYRKEIGGLLEKMDKELKDNKSLI